MTGSLTKSPESLHLSVNVSLTIATSNKGNQLQSVMSLNTASAREKNDEPAETAGPKLANQSVVCCLLLCFAGLYAAGTDTAYHAG